MNFVKSFLRQVAKLLGLDRLRDRSSKRGDTATTGQVDDRSGTPDAPPLTRVESEFKASPGEAPPLTRVESEFKASPAESPPFTSRPSEATPGDVTEPEQG